MTDEVFVQWLCDNEDQLSPELLAVIERMSGIEVDDNDDDDDNQ